MKHLCFTVDDNIRCLKELTEGRYDSIFDHAYLAVYRRLHRKYHLKVQLNLFYEDKTFDLSRMTGRYLPEWQDNADWLKLSFHSRLENVSPYQGATYREVLLDCRRVQEEICRFASPLTLAKTTTIHYCQATCEALEALKDNGVQGLLGLYGTADAPRLSYQNTPEQCERLRVGEVVTDGGIAYAGIDLILNLCQLQDIPTQLDRLIAQDLINLMIHEQYFYADYPLYQPDFEQKLDCAVRYLGERGYSSVFFEDL